MVNEEKIKNIVIFVLLFGFWLPYFVYTLKHNPEYRNVVFGRCKMIWNDVLNIPSTTKEVFEYIFDFLKITPEKFFEFVNVAYVNITSDIGSFFVKVFKKQSKDEVKLVGDVIKYVDIYNQTLD